MRTVMVYRICYRLKKGESPKKKRWSEEVPEEDDSEGRDAEEDEFLADMLKKAMTKTVKGEESSEEDNENQKEEIHEPKEESDNIKGESDNIKGETDNIKGETDNIKGETDNIKGETDLKPTISETDPNEKQKVTILEVETEDNTSRKRRRRADKKKKIDTTSSARLSCPSCGKTFGTRENLKNHIKAMKH